MHETFYAPNDYRNYLEHFGIRGMKWGVRRFQNADGSYTSAGKSRYGVGDGQSYEGVKSVKGNLHRLAAKNYDLNARAWEKMGNKTAAGIQRRFAEDSRRKAETADQAKAQKMASKKQLTPEEKAARNAKIKKAVVVAGTVAATAALAYAGHKYLKNIDAEADKIMRGQKAFSEKAWMANLVSDNAKLNNETHFHRTMYRPGDHSEAAMKSQKRIDDARAERDRTQRIMTEVMGSYNRNIADKQVRKAARRELIQRDITMAPYNAVGKLRKARGSKLDPVSVQFATDDRALRAKQRVEDLARRGRTSESFTKRDSYYSPQRLKNDLSFIGREAAQTAKYKADQLKKKKR